MIPSFGEVRIDRYDTDVPAVLRNQCTDYGREQSGQSRDITMKPERTVKYDTSGIMWLINVFFYGESRVTRI